MIDPLGALVIIVVGVVAGTVNTIVGAGSLLTFPTLLFLGYPPLVANVSNTVGLVPGSDQRRRRLPPRARRPAGQGATAAGRGRARRPHRGVSPARPAGQRVRPDRAGPHPHRLWPRRDPAAAVGLGPRAPGAIGRRARRAVARCSCIGVYLTGIYGGYFGAAQGVILIALLAILVDDDLQRLNGLKNLIATVINGVAAIIFIAVAPVAWVPAILLAIGSTIGGQLGAVVGRRLSPFALRAAIIVDRHDRRGAAADRLTPARSARFGAAMTPMATFRRLDSARAWVWSLGLDLVVVGLGAAPPSAADAADACPLDRRRRPLPQGHVHDPAVVAVVHGRRRADRPQHRRSRRRPQHEPASVATSTGCAVTIGTTCPVSAGVDPAGWTAGLRHFVDDRYRLVASRTFDEALRSAVKRMRQTNLPVAMTVSHGGHGWILTGFWATADPAKTSSFRVTSVRVIGPLYGLQSKNGYDMPPNTKLTPTQLKRFFTPWKYAPKRDDLGRPLRVDPAGPEGCPGCGCRDCRRRPVPRPRPPCRPRSRVRRLSRRRAQVPPRLPARRRLRSPRRSRVAARARVPGPSPDRCH